MDRESSRTSMKGGSNRPLQILEILLPHPLQRIRVHRGHADAVFDHPHPFTFSLAWSELRRQSAGHSGATRVGFGLSDGKLLPQWPSPIHPSLCRTFRASLPPTHAAY